MTEPEPSESKGPVDASPQSDPGKLFVDLAAGLSRMDLNRNAPAWRASPLSGVCFTKDA